MDILHVLVFEESEEVMAIMKIIDIIHIMDCIWYDTLRCIRPPQSQSGTNSFLKTSVFAEWSKQRHETNRINSCYTKTLRNFVYV